MKVESNCLKNWSMLNKLKIANKGKIYNLKIHYLKDKLTRNYFRFTKESVFVNNAVTKLSIY